MSKEIRKDKTYQDVNKASWNRRTELHIKSAFYDMEAFLEGKNTLKPIELQLLGEVRGKTILHLQCHFGQDSLSLARLGAKVVGVDLSDASINKATELNDKLGLDADFICCDLYSLPEHLNGKFDIVFTSYGVIGWLPDLDRWAAIVRQYLRPNGAFVMAEFHPVLWMLDEQGETFLYSYFNKGPITESGKTSYTGNEAPEPFESIGWNHSLAETLQSLTDHGLCVEILREYDYSPYDCLPNSIMTGDDRYQVKGLEGKLPLIFALRAVIR